MLKDQNLAGGVQSGIQVLQKQLFGPGIRVQGQIQHGGLIALQQAAGRHDAGRLLQRKVPPGAGRTAQQAHVAGGRGLGAQHKGPPHSPHHTVHKGILPQHGLFDLGGQPFKAAQMLRLRVGGAFGQQAVILHVPQHLTAVFQRRLGVGILLFQLGILLFQQLVQLFLLLQKGRVQVRQAPGLCLCVRLRRSGTKFHAPACAEYAVHKGFPIVGICHCAALPAVFFQYSVPRPVLQGILPLAKSTPVVYTTDV